MLNKCFVVALAIAFVAAGYSPFSIAKKPTCPGSHPSCSGGSGGGNGESHPANCTLEDGMGYVLRSDGGGAYENSVDGVQCTIGKIKKGLHKLTTGEGDARTAVVNYRASDACGEIVDNTNPEVTRLFDNAITEIAIQTRGNLHDIQVGSPESIRLHVDIADPEGQLGPVRLHYGGVFKGTHCGPDPIISCLSNPTGTKCESWIIDATIASACFLPGPPIVAAYECDLPFKETVVLQ